MNQARYRGTDRAGAGRTGGIEAACVAEFVERKYRQGWRRLDVQYAGRQVGRIHIGDRNRRSWWAEKEAAS